MQLTDTDGAKVKAWFTKKGISHDCPACGAKWAEGAPIYSGRTGAVLGVDSQNMMSISSNPESPALGVVTLVCENCGNVRMFGNMILN
jgi:hypothetical protein